MLRFNLVLFFAFLISFYGINQEIEPENGVHDPKNTTYALTNCKIVVSADLTIPLGNVIIKNGIIERVGPMPVAKLDAVKINMKGYTIYPSFIDIYSNDGMPEVQRKRNSSRYPQLETLTEGPFYWNEAIRPETNGYEAFKSDELKDRKDLVELGFGLINSHVGDGIMRGTSVLVGLGEGKTVDQVINAEASNHFAFSKGSSRQTYPSSQMGMIALIRQFFYDAKWYQGLNIKTKDNISLVEGLENLKLPQIFGVSEQLEVLRAMKIAREFNFPLIVKGGGDEYENIKAIKASGAKLILPLDFADPFDMTDPYAARYVSLNQLKSWEMQAYNPYIVHKNKIPFALTTHGLKKKSDFSKNLKRVLKHGLPANEALRALTETPAKFLRMDHKVGKIESGMLANFLVVKGDLFDGGEIYENWILGERHRIKDIDEVDVRGSYDLNLNNFIYELEIKGELDKPKGEITAYQIKTNPNTGNSTIDTNEIKVDLSFSGKQISMMFELDDENYKGIVQLNGAFHPGLGILDGTGTLPNGQWLEWSAIRDGEAPEDKKKKSELEVDTSAVSNIRFPNMAYGWDTLPKPKTYYIKNATVWTNEAEGILENASVTIKDGKIVAVNGSKPGGAIEIDGTGKHVTSGIIDEHSHIAISKGVNEGGQAISAEVKISDVVRWDDINIYRQLSGGVTAAQLLHGSANPIGGQSALIKLKWGFTPDEMVIDDSLTPGFIKFALGENVKQSNWGDYSTIRFPQTRMGVEQVFYDAFIRAKEYKEDWKAYYSMSANKRKKVNAPRKDLELDALSEILEHTRFITCHSYIQSEINMLMRVGDSMGFTVNTFTHILEGYKVADKMKEHGAGASTFADWWGYKYEVHEAIPYNAAILNEMGIVTAINSDDAEMGRRLNQEAAKVVKYGGVSQEDAWKMVTLNPAKLLHLDDRMGSIKTGKDADVVIWSANPLSIHAKVEKTFIDGILFYDWKKSYEFYDRDQKDRKRIISLMLAAKQGGSGTRKPFMKKNPQYHCDTMDEE